MGKERGVRQGLPERKIGNGISDEYFAKTRCLGKLNRGEGKFGRRRGVYSLNKSAKQRTKVDKEVKGENII